MNNVPPLSVTPQHSFHSSAFFTFPFSHKIHCTSQHCHTIHSSAVLLSVILNPNMKALSSVPFCSHQMIKPQTTAYHVCISHPFIFNKHHIQFPAVKHNVYVNPAWTLSSPATYCSTNDDPSNKSISNMSLLIICMKSITSFPFQSLKMLFRSTLVQPYSISAHVCSQMFAASW